MPEESILERPLKIGDLKIPPGKERLIGLIASGVTILGGLYYLAHRAGSQAATGTSTQAPNYIDPNNVPTGNTTPASASGDPTSTLAQINAELAASLAAIEHGAGLTFEQTTGFTSDQSLSTSSSSGSSGGFSLGGFLGGLLKGFGLSFGSSHASQNNQSYSATNNTSYNGGVALAGSNLSDAEYAATLAEVEALSHAQYAAQTQIADISGGVTQSAPAHTNIIAIPG